MFPGDWIRIHTEHALYKLEKGSYFIVFDASYPHDLFTGIVHKYIKKSSLEEVKLFFKEHFKFKNFK